MSLLHRHTVIVTIQAFNLGRFMLIIVSRVNADHIKGLIDVFITYVLVLV